MHGLTRDVEDQTRRDRLAGLRSLTTCGFRHR